MSTCDFPMRFAKTRRAGKRLTANRKAHEKRRLAKTAASIAAGNVPGITVGARTGHAETGARNTWPQRRPALCEHRFAKSARCSAFRMTRSAHAWPCFSVTAGRVSGAESSATGSTSLTQRPDGLTRATQNTTTSCRLPRKAAPVMCSLTPSASAVNATIRSVSGAGGSSAWTWKDL